MEKGMEEWKFEIFFSFNSELKYFYIWNIYLPKPNRNILLYLISHKILFIFIYLKFG
jgi:hypothetical protein